MDHHEARIERQKCDVRRQESRVREARKVLKFTFDKGELDIKRAEAELAKVKIDSEQAYEKQKSELEQQEAFLDNEKILLKAIEDNLTNEHGDL